MARVLVTGGTGFVGAHCLIRLLAAGHETHTTVRDLEHFPAKWAPVSLSLAMFRNSDIAEKMRQNKMLEAFSDSIESENALTREGDVRAMLRQ
ncbi:MAG TPA: NAD-dependent epimerase/dehydratase family protein [Methylocella sp.]|nr:NAD-dependent epimerase/dehydratase family protein [Methylocella sp.]